MLYPLKFTPRYKERVWGGDKLKGFGTIPKEKKIGESWLLSAVQGDLSVVCEGKLKGNDIEELVEVYMGDLVGDRVYNKYGIEFPLLIKLLDARENLSVQVHPCDAAARERHNSYGKTEMWYVLEAEPGAVLYAGFNRKVTKEEYLRAVMEGTLPELLNVVEVEAGDALFIPSGTVHSIGKGVVLVEIQQTSDITYRIYDWGRTGGDGKPRELHTDLAIDAIDFGAIDLKPVKTAPRSDEAVEVVGSEYFTTNLIKLDNRVERRFPALDSFIIYISVEGSCKLEYSKGSVGINRGEAVLVPAQEESLVLTGRGALLESYIE